MALVCLGPMFCTSPYWSRLLALASHSQESMASKLPAGFFDSKPARASQAALPPSQRSANAGRSAHLHSRQVSEGSFAASKGGGSSPGGSKLIPPTAGGGVEGPSSRGKIAASGAHSKASSSRRASTASEGNPAASTTPWHQNQNTAQATPRSGSQAGGGPQSKLPEGFFDDVNADSKARGMEVKKLDIK